MIVYLGFGNSDDKLPQRDWALLQITLKEALHVFGGTVYGEWHSYPDSMFQNACLALDIDDEKIPEAKGIVRAVAVEFKQDAIAWNEVTETEFLGPTGHTLNHPNSDRWTGGDKKDVA